MKVAEKIRKEKFFKAGEDTIKKVLKKINNIKPETGISLIEGLYKVYGDECIKFLIDFGVDFGKNNSEIYENMKRVFNSIIETKFLGIQVFKIVLSFYKDKYSSKSVKVEGEGWIKIDWEYEYLRAKKVIDSQNAEILRLRTCLDKNLPIIKQKYENIDKIKALSDEEAVRRYCDNEEDINKCMNIIKDIKEDCLNLVDRFFCCSGKGIYVLMMYY